jgi:hypothetical protein
LIQDDTLYQLVDMAASITLPPFAEILPSAPYREFRTLGPLFALRGIPAFLSGKRSPKASVRVRLLDVFAQQGFVVLQGDGTTRIETETLIVGTDDASTQKFGPSWRLIRLPSGTIRRSWLAAIDRRATRSASATRSHLSWQSRQVHE